MFSIFSQCVDLQRHALFSSESLVCYFADISRSCKYVLAIIWVYFYHKRQKVEKISYLDNHSVLKQKLALKVQEVEKLFIW